jgi:hypothetical protein
MTQDCCSPTLKPRKAAGPGGIRILALMYPHLVADKFVTSIVKIVEKPQKISFLPKLSC